MSWRSSISLLKGKIFLIYYTQVRTCQCCQKTQCFCFGWPRTSQEELGGSSWGCRRPWGGLLAQAACFFRGMPFRRLWNKVLKHLEKYDAAYPRQKLFSFFFVCLVLFLWEHTHMHIIKNSNYKERLSSKICFLLTCFPVSCPLVFPLLRQCYYNF